MLTKEEFDKLRSNLSLKTEKEDLPFGEDKEVVVEDLNTKEKKASKKKLEESRKKQAKVLFKEELEEFKKQKEASEKAQALEEIEESNFRPIQPDKSLTFNNKVSNALSLLEDKEALVIENALSRNSLYGISSHNNYLVVLIQDIDYTSTRKITEFDKIVLDAIYTISRENKYFDITMIKRLITGDNNVKINSKTSLDDEIKLSILKLRLTLITFTNKEVENNEKIKNDDLYHILRVRDVILPLREITIRKGGVDKTCFTFSSKPIYFSYAEYKNQIITKDTSMLSLGISHSSKESCVVSNYISTRVLDMKYQYKTNKGHTYIDKIKIDNIYEMLNLSVFDYNRFANMQVYRNKKSDIKNMIKNILKEYTQTKIIKDFKIDKENITILL